MNPRNTSFIRTRTLEEDLEALGNFLQCEQCWGAVSRKLLKIHKLFVLVVNIMIFTCPPLSPLPVPKVTKNCINFHSLMMTFNSQNPRPREFHLFRHFKFPFIFIVIIIVLPSYHRPQLLVIFVGRLFNLKRRKASNCVLSPWTMTFTSLCLFALIVLFWLPCQGCPLFPTILWIAEAFTGPVSAAAAGGCWVRGHAVTRKNRGQEEGER